MSQNSGTNEIDPSTMQQIRGTALGQLVLVPPSSSFQFDYGIGTTGHAPAPTTLTTITVSTDEEDPVTEEEPLPENFRAILGFEGVPADGDSGRKRYLVPGGFDHRPLPLGWSVQFADLPQHEGKLPAGRIDSIEWIPAADFAEEGFELPPDLPEGVMVVFGRGTWDLEGEHGREAARLVRGKFMRGVSLDPVDVVVVPLDAETFEELDPEAMSLEDILMGDHVVGFKTGTYSGATLLAEPAFGHAMVAAAFLSGWTQILNDEDVLVACAAGPLKPSSRFFSKIKFTKRTPITVTEEGEYFGHIATWDCHMGDDVRCFRAQRSRDGYAHFHTGKIVTAEGEHIAVGRITVKEHASFGADRDAVMAHYSDPKKVGAYVVIWEDEFGIAAHGVTKSDASPEILRDLYANPPSPDWRRGELLGVSTVPLPGLPVVDPQAVLVASAEGIPEVEVLILPPLGPEDFVEEATESDVLVAAAAVQGDDALLALIVGE